jgi:uncharacterized RDD family membrane protein YckC
VSAGRAPAPLGRRFAAVVYEALLLTAVVLVAGFLTLPLVTSGGEAGLRVPALPVRTFSFALVFAAAAAYCTYFWSRGRRTLPMKTWRLMLVRVDGGPVDPRTAFVRYLATWIGPVLALAAFLVLRRFGLGAHAAWLIAFNFLWALVDPERRFLHDRIAGTTLVADHAPRADVA